MAKVNPSTKLGVNAELNRSIKKAVIPIAGLGTRFLPLTKVVAKELFPLIDKPILQYIVEEVIASGIEEIIFVNRPEKKIVLNYFKKYLAESPELERILKQRKKNHLLKELKNLEKISKKISFSQVIQKRALGDGNAILQAEKLLDKNPCAVLWADDVVESKIPCILQLIKVFEKYKKPIIGLYRIPKESFRFYGMVGVKKIANRIYKIEKIVEKPRTRKEAPSDLAVVGRYIFTQKVFEWLKKAPLNKNQESITSEILAEKIKEGEEILGYEFEGKWLECGNKLAYLKSNLFLSLRHPQFGKELKKFLKNP